MFIVDIKGFHSLRFPKSSLLLILPLIGTGFSARAGTRVVLNEKAVAKAGTKITDFVPGGGMEDRTGGQGKRQITGNDSERHPRLYITNTMIIATFHISLNPAL